MKDGAQVIGLITVRLVEGVGVLIGLGSSISVPIADIDQAPSGASDKHNQQALILIRLIFEPTDDRGYVTG